MSVSVEVTAMRRGMKKATDVAPTSVTAMKKSKGSNILEEPLKKVLEIYPEIGDFLREKNIWCEGCQLYHLANLKEVIACYKLDIKEVEGVLNKQEIN